ncbi:MAG: hypothetical protein QOI89_1754, partial [Solirubrobacteraceae bacterium]|nr:hypothetical protein [Solirubrobacteraceae bacterium]
VPECANVEAREAPAGGCYNAACEAQSR